MTNKKPKFLDRLANTLGYVKGIALSTIATYGGRAYPSSKSSDQLASYVSWVYASVKARSRDVAKLSLHLYKVTNRKTGEIVEITDHQVLSLLRSVNPFMSLKQLLENTQAYKDLTGEAFWYLQRANDKPSGPITQIWILRPDYMEIKTNSDGFISGYVYKVPGQGPINLEISQVIHHKTFNPINPYRGMSVVSAAAVTIDTDSYAEEYNKNFFRNSAVPDAILSTEQKLSDEQVKRMRSQWDATYGSTRNSHKVAILEGGLELTPFALSQKDMEFLAGQNFTRDKILAIFEVPKSRLGMTEGVSVSNAEATINIYLKYLVRPLMEEMKDVLSEFLLPLYPDAKDMFFQIDDPVPEDVNSEMTRLKGMFEIGAITPNEIRSEQGYDEIPGLDRFYLPTSVSPVSEDGTLESSDPNPTPKYITAPKVKGRVKKIVPPALRLKDKFRDELTKEISDAVINAVGATTPSISKKSADQEFKSSWPIEKKEAFWKAMISKTDKHEAEYKKLLVEIFKDQEKRTIALLDKTQKSIEKISTEDLNRVLISITEENKIAIDILLPLIKTILEENGEDTLDFLLDDNTAFDAQTEAVKTFLSKDALRGIKLMNKVTKAKLRQVLKQAVEDGIGPIATAELIKGVFKEATDVRALRIARTETLKAANRGTLEAYVQSGVVVGKEWFTALDEGVCQWCGPMHGKVQKVQDEFFFKGETYIGKNGGVLKLDFEGVPTPPLHPNCRCTLVPITLSGEKQ